MARASTPAPARTNAADKERAKTRPAGRAKAAPADGADKLAPYKAKRDFGRTAEPKGAAPAESIGRFVVQKHAARRLHYDLRLELDGVLKSWAVTRGPSLVPSEKRLAVHTEDHPIEYLEFEGVIPAGEYGGGTMIVWDRGRWTADGDPHKGYDKGHLEFELDGERLHGRWHLVRMRPRAREKTEQWLLIKGGDAFARAEGEPEIVAEETTSVISGRTNDDLAAGGEVRADHAARAGAKAKAEAARPARARGPNPAAPKGARKGILPPFVEPCLATLSDTAPEGAGWLHEIKFDGYRVEARIEGGKARMLTRRGHDWTDRFAPIAEALSGVAAGAALIDGEVVVEDEGGVSSFAALQADLGAGRTDRMVYHVFDLLHLDGEDYTRVPQVERKLRLAALLDDLPADGRVRYSDHMEGDGPAMARHACRLGLEGIISKKRDAPYRSGRGGSWLKVKCVEAEDFVVAGFVPSSTRRKAIGSLVLGQYQDGRLVHVGRVGTGFTADMAASLHALLDAERRPDPPFAEKLPTGAAKGVRWVEPRHVAEVELRGRTAEGLLRHASFKGLREDKAPAEAVREAGAVDGAPGDGGRAAAGAGVLTHPDRLFWPEAGITKQGLADFYAGIADFILPHVTGRPLALVRCPSGVGADCFFQKHAFAGMSEAVKRRKVGDEEVLYIEDLDGLIALVQAGVLEIHPWGARIDDPDRPDRLVFDLDPDEGLAFSAVVEAAAAVRDRLAAEGLVSFLKTTGGKGLHVVVPLAPKADWTAAKAFALSIASGMAADQPDRYTDALPLKARKGRIFVDYLRNARGATAVAAYSTRARARPTVATPLGWDELTPSLGPAHFTVETLPARLRHMTADPWADLPTVDQALPAIKTKRR